MIEAFWHSMRYRFHLCWKVTNLAECVFLALIFPLCGILEKGNAPLSFTGMIVVWLLAIPLTSLLILTGQSIRYAYDFRGYDVIQSAFGIKGKRIPKSQYFDPEKTIIHWNIAEERIIASAIRQRDGTLFIAMAPGRHHHNRWHISEFKRRYHDHNGHSTDQGFYTNKGRFLNREESLALVRRTGQFTGETIGSVLTSEDLWETPPEVTYFAYYQDKLDRKKGRQ